MNIIGYMQSDSFEKIAHCIIDKVPEGSVFELTVLNEKEASTSDHLCVYIDDQLYYDLDFDKRKYQKLRTDNIYSEFYMTDREAFSLYMYLNNFGAKVTPHWWPYAARNIERHGNPLAALMEAKIHDKKIVVTNYKK